MPTLVEINIINKHMRLLKSKRHMPTEYYPRRLPNLPRKNREDQPTHKLGFNDLIVYTI